MDEVKEIMDENKDSAGGTAVEEIAVEETATEETEESVAGEETAAAAQESGDKNDIGSVRQALEEAREAEAKAYKGLSNASTLTSRQKGVLLLAELETVEIPTQEQLDEKCRLILESYYLPHIVQNGYSFRLAPEFTRCEDPGRDYIEAKFYNSSGREMTVGYNYKVTEDGKNILIFEKTFENVILKPGDPEKYVLYGRDGVTETESFSMEELKEKMEDGEVVKVEEGYFLKARDEDGNIDKGVTTPIIEDEGIRNVKIIFGNNEQTRFSIGKNGQLTCATTNDVTTATIETRKFSSGPMYNSADDARAAASGELKEGESNPKINISMESTTVAEFNYIPTYTTSIELVGMTRKLGKGIEGFDPNESDEENLRRQMAKPITEYLEEKGFYVLDIRCENLEADVTENVGFINTIKTYHMTGGVVSATYIKKLTSVVSIKQGFLSRNQNNDPGTILAQLPEGSELLNPQGIDWKNSKPEVEYLTRGSITATGSARSMEEAEDKAAENAILEAQKVVARSLNGGIASGIREAIGANGAVSTIPNVRARLDTAVVSKNDMQLTHKDSKYAYSGTCDRTVTSTENKLVSVTSWNGNLLTYVEPTEPVIDKGIPTDDNYDKYVESGDDEDILVFEKTDRGLRRYMNDVLGAQANARAYREIYKKARLKLQEIQETFDTLLNEILEAAEEKDEKSEIPISKEEAFEGETEMPALSEATVLEEDEAAEESSAPEGTEEAAGEMTASEEETAENSAASIDKAAAQEALLAIFGDLPDDSDSEEVVVPEEEVAASGEPLDVEDESAVDAAWEKLLMGMPKEDE